LSGALPSVWLRSQRLTNNPVQSPWHSPPRALQPFQPRQSWCSATSERSKRLFDEHQAESLGPDQ
jgi:hypothetical protein